MQNMSLRAAVRTASVFVTEESRRTARLLDRLTSRNVSLDAYEADPQTFWHPVEQRKEASRAGYRPRGRRH